MPNLMLFSPVLCALFFPTGNIPFLKTYVPYIIALFVVLIVALKGSKLIVSRNIAVLFTITLLTVVLSALNSVDVDKYSLIKELIRATSLLFWIQYVIVVSSALKLRNGFDALTLIATTFIYLNFLVVMGQFFGFGLFDIYVQKGHEAESLGFRATGLMANPNLSAFTTGLLINFALIGKSTIKSLGLIFLALLTALIVQSRSGVLVVLVSILIFYILISPNRKSLYYFIAFFILLALTLIFYSVDFERFGYLLDATSKIDDITQINSVSTRIQVLETVLRESPSYPSLIGFKIASSGDIMDNEYLYIYAHRGVFGLFLLIVILLEVYKKIRRRFEGMIPYLGSYFMIYGLVSIQAETFSSHLHAILFVLPLFAAYSTSKENQIDLQLRPF